MNLQLLSCESGIIEIPQEYIETIKNVKTVKVLINQEPEITKDYGIIYELINNPIKVEQFTPLTREEAHERKKYKFFLMKAF